MSISPVGGYIYILYNSSLRDNYLKIGLTERTPDERAKELSRTTGVAQRFLVAYSRPVSDPKKIEHEIHKYLDKFRVNDKREFFELPLEQAVRVVRKIADREASISTWKGINYLTSNSIMRWQCLSGDLFIISRYLSPFDAEPKIIDVWEARDDGDEVVFSTHDNFDISTFVPETYLVEQIDLRPGDRFSWVSRSRDGVITTPLPFTAHLECREFTNAFALSVTPRSTPEGYPILFSAPSPPASPELARIAYKEVLTFGKPRKWA